MQLCIIVWCSWKCHSSIKFHAEIRKYDINTTTIFFCVTLQACTHLKLTTRRFVNRAISRSELGQLRVVLRCQTQLLIQSLASTPGSFQTRTDFVPSYIPTATIQRSCFTPFSTASTAQKSMKVSFEPKHSSFMLYNSLKDIWSFANGTLSLNNSQEACSRARLIFFSIHVQMIVNLSTILWSVLFSSWSKKSKRFKISKWLIASKVYFKMFLWQHYIY